MEPNIKRLKLISILVAVTFASTILFGPSRIITAYAEEPTVNTDSQPIGSDSPSLVSEPIAALMADIIAPTIDLTTLSVNQSTALPGDTITIQVKATDDSTGVKNIYIRLMNEHGASLSGFAYIPNPDGYYQWSFPITENTQSGNWSIDYLRAEDNNTNSKLYMSLSYDLSAADFVVDSQADIIDPTIDLTTLSVNQSTALPGDTINIQVQASDDSTGVKNIYIRLMNEHGASLSGFAYTPNPDGYYQWSFPITENTQSGNWSIDYLRAEDNNTNSKLYMSLSYDLSAADFVVDSQADIIDPTIDLTTLSVNQSTALPGDTINIQVQASDDSTGVKNIYIRLMNEHGASLSGFAYTPNPDGYYQWSFPITENTQSGNWSIDYLRAEDNNTNSKLYMSLSYDLSAADFVVEVLDVPENLINAEYVTSNTTWNYKTIDRDVYVGPDAILTINGDVKINGNLYILGAVVSYGKLTVNQVHANYSYYGSSSTINQGSFNLRSGTHSITTITVSNFPIPSIPIEIYSSNMVNPNGELTLLEGATLPIADLYINGVETEYNYNGTFSIPNYYVGSKQSLELKMVDIFGDTHYFNYLLDQSNGLPPSDLSTVTFDSKGGSAVDPQFVAYNDKATEPTEITICNVIINCIMRIVF